jgi:hypothetical protein
LGELSAEQSEIYQQFREWMREGGLPANPWFNDTFYLRFCRARKFDLDKMKIMWTEYLEYRQEYSIDNILGVSGKLNYGTK